MLIRMHLDHITLLDRSDRRDRGRDRGRPGRDPRRPRHRRRRRRPARPRPGRGGAARGRRLAEIPGVSLELARAIIAETGLDMTRFPTAGHLASWAGLAPAARQSGPRSRKPAKGQGDAYLKGYCTQAAAGAASTDTFLGERLRRLSRRLGGTSARCAVGRSILDHHLAPARRPRARFPDLGPDWHHRKTDRDRKIRAHLRQLQALGFEVTITPAA